MFGLRAPGTVFRTFAGLGIDDRTKVKTAVGACLGDNMGGINQDLSSDSLEKICPFGGRLLSNNLGLSQLDKLNCIDCRDF